jgi:hypothetical protein
MSDDRRQNLKEGLSSEALKKGLSSSNLQSGLGNPSNQGKPKESGSSDKKDES